MRSEEAKRLTTKEITALSYIMNNWYYENECSCSRCEHSRKFWSPIKKKLGLFD